MVKGKIVFVKDWGSYLKVNKGMIECYTKKVLKWSISPVEVSAIVFLVNSSISSEVIKLANDYGIDLVFFQGNEPVARVIPAKYGGVIRLWLRQLKSWKKDKLTFAKEFIRGKMYNQSVLLKYYERKYGMTELRESIYNLERLKSEILTVKTVEEVMQKEAEGAKWYWKGVKQLVPEELGFKGRRKLNAKDPFNIALNIGYGMLRRSVWKAIVTVGLNPYLGFLHKMRSGRPSLVFDLMEEFRAPFVDRPLTGLAREDPEGIKDKKNIYSKLVSSIKEEEIFTQARRLVNALDGEEYRPFLDK